MSDASPGPESTPAGRVASPIAIRTAAVLVVLVTLYLARHRIRRQVGWLTHLISRVAYAVGIADTRAIAARWRERR